MIHILWWLFRIWRKFLHNFCANSELRWLENVTGLGCSNNGPQYTLSSTSSTYSTLKRFFALSRDAGPWSSILPKRFRSDLMLPATLQLSAYHFGSTPSFTRSINGRIAMPYMDIARGLPWVVHSCDKRVFPFTLKFEIVPYDNTVHRQAFSKYFAATTTRFCVIRDALTTFQSLWCLRNLTEAHPLTDW